MSETREGRRRPSSVAWLRIRPDWRPVWRGSLEDYDAQWQLWFAEARRLNGVEEARAEEER